MCVLLTKNPNIAWLSGVDGFRSLIRKPVFCQHSIPQLFDLCTIQLSETLSEADSLSEALGPVAPIVLPLRLSPGLRFFLHEAPNCNRSSCGFGCQDPRGSLRMANIYIGLFLGLLCLQKCIVKFKEEDKGGTTNVQH